jgi:hypothetical protein
MSGKLAVITVLFDQGLRQFRWFSDGSSNRRISHQGRIITGFRYVTNARMFRLGAAQRIERNFLHKMFGT